MANVKEERRITGTALSEWIQSYNLHLWDLCWCDILYCKAAPKNPLKKNKRITHERQCRRKKIRQASSAARMMGCDPRRFWNRCKRWSLCDHLNKRIHGSSSREVDEKIREEECSKIAPKMWCFTAFLSYTVRQSCLNDECLCGVCLMMDLVKDPASYPQWLFFFTWKQNALKHVKLITELFTAHQRTKQRNKMCQMNVSARGEFQGPCVGVLCGSAEWEERQVNTWCQKERSSPYFSVLLTVEVRFEYTDLCLAVFWCTLIFLYY